MKKSIGKVIDVFIPKEYKNNNLLDVMDRSYIGFKILINNELQKFIFFQDEFNSNIMKNDLVLITTQLIDKKEFIDIDKYFGDRYG